MRISVYRDPKIRVCMCLNVEDAFDTSGYKHRRRRRPMMKEIQNRRDKTTNKTVQDRIAKSHVRPKEQKNHDKSRKNMYFSKYALEKLIIMSCGRFILMSPWWADGVC